MNRNIHKADRRRCIIALVLCLLMVILVAVGVVVKLVAPSTVDDPDEGIRSFRYFTVLSNILVGVCAVLCIPFEIDGLRNENYHLPRWIVDLLFVGVTGVAITFLIVIFILTPVMGVEYMLLSPSGRFLHLACPLLSIALFLAINTDHHIKFNRTYMAVVPLLIYAAVYIVQVFVIGEENGGWWDHYYTNAYMPFWIPLIIIPLIGFAIACLLRKLHNDAHIRHKEMTREYYMSSGEVSFPTVEEAVQNLARRAAGKYTEGDVTVPLRIIGMMNEKYKSSLSMEELSEIYLRAFFDAKDRY